MVDKKYGPPRPAATTDDERRRRKTRCASGALLTPAIVIAEIDNLLPKLSLTSFLRNIFTDFYSNF